ncbi:hypothetical protein CcI49_18645 [Frankia sp. CcI49]|nr:hypothetical protein CcI49_18645 [Frankia sp. CcI49]
MAAGADGAQRPDAQSMITLLDRVVVLQAPIDTALLTDFARRVLDLMVAEGPGADFREPARFLEVTDAVIDIAQARGAPVTDLLLTQAQYYAFFADLGQGRLARISRAVASAATDEEETRAVLTLVRFHLDGSAYRKARLLLESCDRALDPASALRGSLLDLHATRGILHFYSDKALAEKSFTRVLEMAPAAELTDYEGRSVGLALHYLGRIRAAQRRLDEALDLLLRGDRTRERYSGPHLKGTAFNNLRIAEILLSVGEIAAAQHHLNRCAELLLLIGESSNAELQMNLVAARLERARGRPHEAELILRRCLRRTGQDPNPRALLQCLYEMCRIHAWARRPARVATTLAQGAVLFLRTQVRSPRGFLQAVREGVRVAIPRSLPRPRSRVPRSAAGPPAGVRCPCGEHGYDDE